MRDVEGPVVHSKFAVARCICVYSRHITHEAASIKQREIDVRIRFRQGSAKRVCGGHLRRTTTRRRQLNGLRQQHCPCTPSSLSRSPLVDNSHFKFPHIQWFWAPPFIYSNGGVLASRDCLRSSSATTIDRFQLTIENDISPAILILGAVSFPRSI